MMALSLSMQYKYSTSTSICRQCEHSRSSSSSSSDKKSPSMMPLREEGFRAQSQVRVGERGVDESERQQQVDHDRPKSGRVGQEGTCRGHPRANRRARWHSRNSEFCREVEGVEETGHRKHCRHQEGDDQGRDQGGAIGGVCTDLGSRLQGIRTGRMASIDRLRRHERGGTVFECDAVDLSEGDWSEYCEKSSMPLSIMEIEHRFETA